MKEPGACGPAAFNCKSKEFIHEAAAAASIT
jgi:hypothetical protein